MTPIIDSHVHFFDPTRPGGIPWPTQDLAALYKPALPPRLKSICHTFGIAGCIAVECSPLPTDNDWLLNVAEHDSFVLGVIGDLDPADPGFRAQLDRLERNPLYRGIRYGNLWNRDLFADLSKSHFVDNLQALADAGLVLESANPDPRLISALLRVVDRVPKLRVIIDHLPNAKLPGDTNALAAFHHDLAVLARHTRVYVKLSEIPVVKDNTLILDKRFYRNRVEPLWDLFGPRRVIFGSDWPNSDQIAPYDQTFAIVSEYMSSKSLDDRERYFWSNSQAAYGWKPRTA
ncbi:MAG: amidohydrolase family protein [Acidobacteria bacterium]|nr:amidohydrolase family protein [Acidobacteriota bacterium]